MVWRDGVKAGHEVMFSSPHPERVKRLAGDLGACALAGSGAEAAAFGAVVLIATPYGALAALGLLRVNSSRASSPPAS
jgi:predicted dinucleotide-binding enzyme